LASGLHLGPDGKLTDPVVGFKGVDREGTKGQREWGSSPSHQSLDPPVQLGTTKHTKTHHGNRQQCYVIAAPTSMVWPILGSRTAKEQNRQAAPGKSIYAAAYLYSETTA